MASDPEIPEFGLLLAPVIGELPPELLPLLLSGLEVAAAGRYRVWAEAERDPDASAGLLACADREEQIAARVAKLFPIDGPEQAKVDATLPAAREAFMAVFTPHATRAQQHIQAGAERQGAAAWRQLADGQSDPDRKRELLACAELEEDSAVFLEKLLQR